MDIIYGQVIPASYCQGQRTYLIDVGLVYANKTGYTAYADTLTVGVTRFNRVVQLDTTRLEPYLMKRLQQFQPGGKIAIYFNDHTRTILPGCFSQYPRSLATVVVDEFGLADY